ncbi:MAG: homogentisate 1,2-dioxygenase [Sphingomonadales bacterium]|nr:homogentisate 1,2-dioxygenase [Sphingomonadales bacterium]
MKTILVALALTISAPVAAETCAVPEGWDKPTPHLAARKAPFKFGLAVGPATRLTLLPAGEVTPVVGLGHKAKAGTSAGLAALDVSRAGKLDIALSTAAYVDLVSDGKIVASSGHRHGDACTGIRKIVTFDVKPGRYVVQLSDAPGTSIVMQASLN